MDKNQQTLVLLRTECAAGLGCRGLLYRWSAARSTYLCLTLEPPLVVNGADGTQEGSGAALPPGRYGLKPVLSPRFGRWLLKLMPPEGMPDRQILIHAGNTEADTRGCILTGTSWHSRRPFTLVDSRVALGRVELKKGCIYLLNPGTLLQGTPAGLWQQTLRDATARGYRMPAQWLEGLNFVKNQSTDPTT